MVGVNTMNMLFASGSMVILITIIALLIIVFGFSDHDITVSVRLGIDEHGIRLAALAAVMASLGSLYYSEFAGLTPCKFCHYQRHAMYPLAILLPLGVLRDDDGVRLYGMVIAGIGLIISSYHVRMQFWPDTVKATCSLDAPCTQRLVTVFEDVLLWPGTDAAGISIPMMAWSFFLAILVILGFTRSYTHDFGADE